MNGDNSNILKAVPEEDWPKVRDTYKRDWPYGIYPYYTVENFIRWREKGFDNKFSVYCLDGRYDDGTTIMVSILEDTQNIHVFTYEKSCERLKEALKNSKHAIDWSLELFFYAVHEDHFPHVDDTMKMLGLKTEFEVHSGYYWIAQEKALQFDTECPSDVYVDELSEKDVITIDNVWPHKYPGSLNYLEVLVRMNGGLGVFLKKDDSLCCWILKNHHYGLGILQTADEHKRKGYAKLVTKFMAKKMAEDGLNVHTCIVKDNIVSREMFKKLGFELIKNIVYSKYLGFPNDTIR